MDLKAKIKSYTVSEAKNGNPQVAIQFNVLMPDGSQKTLSWYGSFSGGAKDITLKALIICGLKDFRGLKNLVNGVASGLLDCTKELVLVAEDEMYRKESGAMGTRTNVKFINDPAMAPQIKKIDPAKNVQFFNTMGFDQDLMRISGEMEVPLNGGQVQNPNQNQNQNHNVNQGQSQNQNMNQGQNQNMNQSQGQNQQMNNQMQQGQGQNMNQGQMNGNNLPF